MKKIITIILLLFIFLGLTLILPISAKDNSIDEFIELYYMNQRIEKMTIKEWEAMVSGASIFKKERDAEIADPIRVKIIAVDDVWAITNPDQFETEMLVQWLDENNIVFKEFFVKVEITLDKSTCNFSQWRIKYRNVAEIITPISVVSNIFFIVIIILIL